MKLTLSDIVESYLNTNPEFYSMLSKKQKVINNNILLSDGKYFDKVEKKVKVIPYHSKIRFDENYNLIIELSTMNSE